MGARQARALLEAMCASTSNPLRESGRRLGGANVAVLRVRAKRPCAPRHESWPTRSGVWAFSVLHPVAVALEKQAWRRLERGLCPAGARRAMRWLDISGPRLLLHHPKVRPQHLGSVRWPHAAPKLRFPAFHRTQEWMGYEKCCDRWLPATVPGLCRACALDERTCVQVRNAAPVGEPPARKRAPAGGRHEAAEPAYEAAPKTLDHSCYV